MKAILLCCLVALALLSCSCGKSPEPPKNNKSQVSQSKPQKKTLVIDGIEYPGKSYISINDIETKTDYTNWFTWKNYDGKKENAERAVYIWNGEEVGRGNSGFGEILKRIESMPNPVKYKLGLSVFCPHIHPISSEKAEQFGQKDKLFYVHIFISRPFNKTNKEYNKIVKTYSEVDELEFVSGSAPFYLPFYEHTYGYDFEQNCPFDRSRLESLLRKKKIHVAYVKYEKHVSVPDGDKPASKWSQKAGK